MLTENPQVVFAYLFGGLARGEPKPLSDVDIAVYLEDTADPLSIKLDLIGIITEALGTDEVDLVILNRALLSLIVCKKKREIPFPAAELLTAATTSPEYVHKPG